MKTRSLLAAGLVALLAIPSMAEAEPGGCLKYGAAGAVAGHMAGHGVMGAMGGCVAGMYARHKAREAAERQRTDELNAASQRGGPAGVNEYQRTAQPLPEDPAFRRGSNNR
jgi:hypothetical protein